jgi:hypothetical protein
MEEDEYKAAYQEIAKIRCVFEKALTNNQCKCRFSQHFWLADREGYACKSSELASKCGYFLENLRNNSRFLLKVHTVGSQLPHNVDIRVQAGGLRGLSVTLESGEDDGQVADIQSLIERAIDKYESLDALPYSEIVQSIARFKGRKKSKKKP